MLRIFLLGVLPLVTMAQNDTSSIEEITVHRIVTIKDFVLRNDTCWMQMAWTVTYDGENFERLDLGFWVVSQNDSVSIPSRLSLFVNTILGKNVNYKMEASYEMFYYSTWLNPHCANKVNVPKRFQPDKQIEFCILKISKFIPLKSFN